MDYKGIIKKLVPNYFLNKYYLYRNSEESKDYYLHDAKVFIESTYLNKEKHRILARITMHCHSIEKGLTFNERKYGFGQERMNILIADILSYIKKFGTDNELKKIIQVIAEYRHFHLNKEELLDDALLIRITKLLELFPDISVNKIQLDYSASEYFSDQSSSFDKFSNSRHSVRNFNSTPVSIQTIIDSVKLAQNAPSSCNRQPSRVYIVENKETIKEIFKLQGGNRGFGHLVDKLIIITGYLGVYNDVTERNTVYIDTGIFTLNLAYSLHFYNIAACILNWSASLPKDERLHLMLNIPYNEAISTLIACGNTNNDFKVCNSSKLEYPSIIKII